MKDLIQFKLENNQLTHITKEFVQALSTSFAFIYLKGNPIDNMSAELIERSAFLLDKLRAYFDNYSET